MDWIPGISTGMNSEADIKDWNAIAPDYSKRIEAGGDRCFPEVAARFWELLGDVQEKGILDLGCGQGWLTKELSDRGAVVTGIDGSTVLVDRARSLHPDQAFHVCDLAKGLPELGREFDIVVSHMVVMDIPEINLLFSDVARALKPGGTFLFTLPHPCFFNMKSHKGEDGRWFKKLTGYLKREVWRIDSFGGHNHYHRTISDYVAALSQADLFVFEFYKPPHRAKSKEISDEFLKTLPVFLLIAARKVISGTGSVHTEESKQTTNHEKGHEKKHIR